MLKIDMHDWNGTGAPTLMSSPMVNATPYALCLIPYALCLMLAAMLEFGIWHFQTTADETDFAFVCVSKAFCVCLCVCACV